jgi:hypothetical protein
VEDFQIEFMDAVLALPYLSAFTIYTGYKMTSTEYTLANEVLSKK